MVEINCHTCGAKVTAIDWDCDGPNSIKPLAQSGLTKLKEIYEKFLPHKNNRWLFLSHEECLTILMDTIKEFLEDNKL